MKSLNLRIVFLQQPMAAVPCVDIVEAMVTEVFLRSNMGNVVGAGSDRTASSTRERE